MLMVIFGAGASYDSDPSNQPTRSGAKDPNRPPLANELFDDRPQFRTELARFPQCAPLVPRLRHPPAGVTIEQVLEQHRDESDSPVNPDRERVKQLAAVQFYLQAAIERCSTAWDASTNGITNYATLLDDIRHFGNRCPTLVTFNYDLLLEGALRRLTGWVPDKIGQYVDGGPGTLVKLRGSVDWGRVVYGMQPDTQGDPDQIATGLIQNAAALELTEDYRLVHTRSPVEQDGTQMLFPAIAIPFQNKTRFACPPEHIQALTRRLEQTTHVLVIGWRALDRTFSALLRRHLPTQPKMQIICGPADGEAVQTALRQAGVRAEIRILERTFSSYVLSRAGHEFLAEAGRVG